MRLGATPQPDGTVHDLRFSAGGAETEQVVGILGPTSSRGEAGVLGARGRLSWICTAATLAAFVVVAVAHATALIQTDDAWLHLAAGRHILEAGSLPDHDPFLNSADGPPWVVHSWLAEVVFYSLMEAGGLPLLLAFRAVLVVGALGLVVVWAVRGGAKPYLAGVAAVSILFLSGGRATLMRPLLFSHLLFVVFVLISSGVCTRRYRLRALLWLPLLMGLWCNLHAGHLLGIAIAGLLPATRVVDRLIGRADPTDGSPPLVVGLAVAVAVALSAAVLNAYGVWTYMLDLVWPQHGEALVTEWVGAVPARYPGIFAALGAAWLVTVFRLRRARTFDLLVLALASAMTLFASRFLLFGAVAAAYALAVGVSELIAASSDRRRNALEAIASIACVLIALGATVDAVRHRRGFALSINERVFPVDALRFMEREGIGGAVLNLREWGGFLLWRRPGHRVFIDGRLAVSAGAVLDDYVAVAEAHPGFAEVLRRRDIEAVLTNHDVMRPSPGAVAQPIANLSGWRLVYFDDVALLYVRANGRHRSLVDEYGFVGLNPGHRRAPLRAGVPPARLEQECLRAIDQQPSERATTYLAWLLEKRGALNEAERQLRRAVALSPSSPQAKHNLALMLVRRGERSAALGLFEEVLDLRPDYPGVEARIARLSGR